MKKLILGCVAFCSMTISAYAAQAITPFQVSPDNWLTSDKTKNLVLNDATCDWRPSLAKYMAQQTKNAANITQEGNNLESRKLNLSFFNSDGEVASKTSPKWISVLGEMLDKNVLIGNFEFRQEITKNSFQDCKTLKTTSEYLMDDVVAWVAVPAIRIRVAPTIATLDQDSLDEGVRKQCAVDTFLPKYLSENSEGRVVLDSSPNRHDKERQLKLVLNNSRVAAGGAYSGAKWMEFSGELLDAGQLVGSFTGHRWTLKGWTACGAAEHIGSTIGDDIVQWLLAPTLNAKLGDAKR